MFSVVALTTYFTPSIIGIIFNMSSIRCLFATITLFPLWTNIYCPPYFFKMLKNSINKAMSFTNQLTLLCWFKPFFVLPYWATLLSFPIPWHHIYNWWVLWWFIFPSHFCHTCFFIISLYLTWHYNYQQNFVHSLWNIQ
jgi:hypothetical protein